MKRLLLSLSAVIGLGLIAQGQVISSENFNSTTGTALPSGWTQSGSGWVTGTPSSFNSTSFGVPSNTDGRFLGINDDQSQSAANTDQLVKTAAMNLSTGTSSLYMKMDLLYAGGSYQGATESLKIKISTNGGATWTDLTTVTGYQDLAWHNYYISLAAYAGQSNVMIGFDYSDGGGWLFGAAIDNLTILNLPSTEIALLSAAPTQGSASSYGAVGSTKSISGVVSNEGANAITSYVVKYQQGSGPIQSYTRTVNIAPFANDTFTHNIPFTIPSAGDFPINVWVELTGDADATNNTQPADVVGVSFMPTKHLLFEEATGTWCGWCPRGTVAMDNFAETHPGAAAQIAVHNSDPMTVSNYDALMGTFISGYPSMIIDRNSVVDPGDLLDNYNALSNSFGFANLTMGSVSVAGGTASVPVTINPAVDIAGAKLALVVTESNLSGPAGSDWDQANYYSGGGSGAMGGFENQADHVANTKFHFVARIASPSPSGAASGLPATLTAGGTYNATLTAAIDPSWNQANLQYIVILMGADGKALNTAFTATPTLDAVLPGGTSVSNIEAGINQMEVYPNPAKDVAHVAFNLKNATDINISITDISGRVVYTTNQHFAAGQNNIPVPTASLSNGIYMITATTDGGKATVKLVVNH